VGDHAAVDVDLLGKLGLFLAFNHVRRRPGIHGVAGHAHSTGCAWLPLVVLFCGGFMRA